MMKIKDIIWVEQSVDIVPDYIYYDGMLNGHQVVSINESYDNKSIPNNSNGYTIYDYIGNTAASDRTIYKTLDDAKLAAKKKVENFIFGLIDMRDYKIKKLLNKKED